MLPEEWSVSLVGSYLVGCVHHLQTHAHTLHVGVALARNVAHAKRARVALLQRQSLLVSDDLYLYSIHTFLTFLMLAK